jgi:hypothetical protein
VATTNKHDQGKNIMAQTSLAAAGLTDAERALIGANQVPVTISFPGSAQRSARTICA